MKKVMMSVALMAAVAVGYMMTGSNESEMNVSDLTSANVEALADDINLVVGCKPSQHYVCFVGGGLFTEKEPIFDNEAAY